MCFSRIFSCWLLTLARALEPRRLLGTRTIESCGRWFRDLDREAERAGGGGSVRKDGRPGRQVGGGFKDVGHVGLAEHFPSRDRKSEPRNAKSCCTMRWPRVRAETGDATSTKVPFGTISGAFPIGRRDWHCKVIPSYEKPFHLVAHRDHGSGAVDCESNSPTS